MRKLLKKTGFCLVFKILKLSNRNIKIRVYSEAILFFYHIPNILHKMKYLKLFVMKTVNVNKEQLVCAIAYQNLNSKI